jgi:hypothetical protein
VKEDEVLRDLEEEEEEEEDDWVRWRLDGCNRGVSSSSSRKRIEGGKTVVDCVLLLLLLLLLLFGIGDFKLRRFWSLLRKAARLDSSLRFSFSVWDRSSERKLALVDCLGCSIDDLFSK